MKYKRPTVKAFFRNDSHCSHGTGANMEGCVGGHGPGGGY
jgi:hypothetical protein